MLLPYAIRQHAQLMDGSTVGPVSARAVHVLVPKFYAGHFSSVIQAQLKDVDRG